MLHQRDLAFLKAIASKSRAHKKTTVPAGTRGISSEGIALHHTTGKRKANELASLGDPSEPGNRLPEPRAATRHCSPNSSRATGEHVASGGRHLVSPEGGATYAAVETANIAPQQPGGPFMSTARVTDPSKPAVSQATSPGRMSPDMYRPNSVIAVGTTKNAQVANLSLPAGERINKTPIFNSGVDYTRAFLAWLWPSFPSKLMAQPQGREVSGSSGHS
jgi:hypothetical protein